MKFTMAIPGNMLEALSPLCDLDFVLAHLQDPVYVEFFRERKAKGHFVLMDNGFHETGRPMSIPELLDAAKLFNPSMIVAPDWLGKPKETYDAFIEFLKHRPKDTGVAVVLQGNTASERAEFFENVRAKCDMICFPFRANRLQWFHELLERIPRHLPWPPLIHLLGCSSLDELFEWKRIATQNRAHAVISVDTTKPIKIGMLKQRITRHSELRNHPGWPRDPKLVQPDQEQLASILYNVAYMRKYV